LSKRQRAGIKKNECSNQ